MSFFFRVEFLHPLSRPHVFLSSSLRDGIRFEGGVDQGGGRASFNFNIEGMSVSARLSPTGRDDDDEEEDDEDEEEQRMRDEDGDEDDDDDGEEVHLDS